MAGGQSENPSIADQPQPEEEEEETTSVDTSVEESAEALSLHHTASESGVPTATNWVFEDHAVKELEPFEYNSLDFTTHEMRFLSLEPGISKTPIDCTLSVQTLADCEPYTYIINTRGNPISWVGFKLDGRRHQVTRNIAVFLDHMRSENAPQRLWFRDICLNHRNADEKARYWNQEWMDTMIKHAEKVVDLSEVMASLWDAGKLPRPFPRWDKEWNKLREAKPTKHHPCPIRLQKGFIDPPPPHEYLPLDYVADEFRLIYLMPTEDYDDPLNASLAYSVMHDDVSYICLSYTWGDSSEIPTYPILLNGQKFMIRKNLDRALREMRPWNVNIWIDAICIDQQNIFERNRQIPRMLEIYEAADVVTSWLGEADEASDRAFDLLADLQSPKLHPDEHGNWGPYKDKVDDEWRIAPIDDLPRRLAALYRLFLRPYFRRIWVIQELASASNPEIFCGKKRETWRRLDMAAYHLMDILHRDSTMPARMMAADTSLKSVLDRDISFVRRLFYFRYLRSRNADHPFGAQQWKLLKPNSPGILDVMILGRDFESSSTHDKIFALLNLAQDLDDIGFRPDYSNSLSQTYQDFVSAVASHTGSLDIIAAAEPFTAAGLQIPGWCPDWSTPSTISSLVRRDHLPNIFMTVMDDISGPVYQACGPPTLSPRFVFKDTILEVAGLILDTVKSVQPKEPDDEKRHFVTSWMTIAANATLSSEERDEHGLNIPFMEKFWSMLAGDVTGVWSIEAIPSSELPPVLNTNVSANTAFHPVCLKEDQCKHRMARTSADTISIVTRGRSLMITEEGLMGLVPHYAEAGQKLAILSKCSVPVLLQEKEDGTYKFLGSVFVQGWMDGKVLTEMGLDTEEAWELLDEAGRLRVV